MDLIRNAGSFLDCKAVGFFLKISKEIGKACRKSLACAKRASGRVGREKKKEEVKNRANYTLN